MPYFRDVPQTRTDTDDSLARAVSEHLPLLLRTARGILKSDDLAMDAVQETLLRIWARGWLPADPKATLVQLVVRSSLHQARCQRRRRDHEGAAAAVGEPCCDEDPLAQLVGQELGETLRSALDGLQPGYRSAFELYELEGLSYDRIAERLGVPIGTVRSRLRRARVQLRDRLGSHFEAA